MLSDMWRRIGGDGRVCLVVWLAGASSGGIESESRC